MCVLNPLITSHPVHEPFKLTGCYILMRNYLTLIIVFTFSMNVFPQSMNGFDITNALVNSSEIKKGGPARDGIPALNYPEFLTITEATFIHNSDIVIGLNIKNESKAYPIKILNWHEIVNDSLANEPMVITYCPLCGTGMVFDSFVHGKTLTFGVSGLLYNSDVLLYDKQTESLWSQMMSQSISGKQKGQKLEILPSDLTTWGQWKQKHPNTLVLSDQTGFNRNYSRNPYLGYEDTDQIYFPVSTSSNKLPVKERVLGVQVNNAFKAYPYSELSKKNGLIEDNFKGVEIKIQFDKESYTATLISPKNISSVSSYWFAWYAFHPYTKIYKH